MRSRHDAIDIPVATEDIAAPNDNGGMTVFFGTINGITETFEVDAGDRSGLTLSGRSGVLISSTGRSVRRSPP